MVLAPQPIFRLIRISRLRRLPAAPPTLPLHSSRHHYSGTAPRSAAVARCFSQSAGTALAQSRVAVTALQPGVHIDGETAMAAVGQRANLLMNLRSPNLVGKRSRPRASEFRAHDPLAPGAEARRAGRPAAGATADRCGHIHPLIGCLGRCRQPEILGRPSIALVVLRWPGR